MVRQRQRPTARRGASNPRNRKGGSGKTLLIVGCVVGILLFGGLLAFLLTRGGSGFSRSTLDRYVQLDNPQKALALPGDGVDVYVDFSDGMQCAYASQEAQTVLRSLLNKLTGASNVFEYHQLANGKISPLNFSQTDIYNYVVNPANYANQRAPIEEALRQITASDRPALLVTDFEEYNGNVVQQQNYAKDYFISWLAAGYNIIFYKIDFVEKGKPKHLYFAVFDDQDNRLGNMVEQAMAQAGWTGVDRFVLGSPEFGHPMATMYLSQRQGGNYHGAKGLDNVSGVVEDGSSEAFTCYAASQATPEGSRSQYTILGDRRGVPAQYYPITVSWADILKNAQALQQEGVPEGDLYLHFIGRLFVDFTCQDGFDITEVEARVFDMQQRIEAFAAVGASDSTATATSPSTVATDADLLSSLPDAPEIHDMLTATATPLNGTVNLANGTSSQGWQEITVDFDPRFDGLFTTGSAAPTDLFRVNVVIASATPNIAKAQEFFSWPGNTSLSQSVVNTLQAQAVNPKGRLLISYYIKLIGQ